MNVHVFDDTFDDIFDDSLVFVSLEVNVHFDDNSYHDISGIHNHDFFDDFPTNGSKSLNI